MGCPPEGGRSTRRIPVRQRRAFSMTSARVHHRFLAYRERHAYFGRNDLRKPLSLSEYGELDAERLRLLAVPPRERTPAQASRLSEVRRLMLED